MNRRQIMRLSPYVILCGGFALRLYHLGADSLWYDETVSLLLARSDVPELISHTAGDIHPPLYYLLLHFWGQFAGWSEFSAAFLSLWFGVFLIPLVYRVTPTLAHSSPGEPKTWTKSVAVIAAFLVALSPYNVWYSQEVRMYTIGAVLGLASVYFMLRMLRAPKIGSRDFWAYVVLTVLGIYTLYYFIFLIAFEYVCFAALLWAGFRRARAAAKQQASADRNRSSVPPAHLQSEIQVVRHPISATLITFLASQFALALLYLPWLPIAFRQATDPPVPPWRSFIAFTDVFSTTLSALVVGESVDPYQSAPLWLGVLLLVAYLLFVSFNKLTKSRPGAGAAGLGSASLLLLAYTFVPTLLIFAFSFWTPLYHPRYIFTYSPAFYILLALAIGVAARQLSRQNTRVRYGLIAGALAALTLASAYSLDNFWFDSQYAEDDLRGAVQHIAENWRPGDVILVNAGYAYPALAYYFPAPELARVRLVDYHPASGGASNTSSGARGMPLVLLTGSIGGRPRLGWNDPHSDFYPTTAEETQAALARVFQSHPRVWMLRIYDTVTDPDGVIRKYFADHARLIDDQAYTGKSNARVQGYLTQVPGALPPNAIRSDAELEDRLKLPGFESPNLKPRPGEYFDAVLYWQPLQTLNYNYQLSLQVLDAAGQVVAQPPDETPLGDALPTSRWRVGELYREPVRVQIPRTLAAGDYAVIVKLYNPNNLEVLGEPIRLTTFHVGP